mgnify:CR=1 FL=1
MSAMMAGIGVGAHNGRSSERQTIAAEVLKLEARAESLEAAVNLLSIEKIVADIIVCESGGRHDGLWGDVGRSYGVAQFNEETFYRFVKKSGAGKLDWKDRNDQIFLLRWAVSNGYGPSWSCYDKATSG